MKPMLMINAAIAAGLAAVFVIAPGQAAPSAAAPALTAKSEQPAAVRPASLQDGPERRAVRVVYPSPFGR